MNLKKKSKLFKHILNFFKKITYKCKKSFLQSTTILIELNEFLGTSWLNNINQNLTIGNYQTYVFNLPEPETVQIVDTLMVNENLIFLIIITVLLLAWLFFFTLLNFQNFNTTLKPKVSHFNDLEEAWAFLPALVLLKVAVPSIFLLYFLNEDNFSFLRLKVIEDQRFWSYEKDIFFFQLGFENKKGKTEIIKFSSYLLFQEKIEKQKCLGLFRLLEKNKKIVLFVKKSIVFFNQCSKICETTRQRFASVLLLSETCDTVLDIKTEVFEKNQSSRDTSAKKTSNGGSSGNPKKPVGLLKFLINYYIGPLVTLVLREFCHLLLLSLIYYDNYVGPVSPKAAIAVFCIIGKVFFFFRDFKEFYENLD